MIHPVGIALKLAKTRGAATTIDGGSSGAGATAESRALLLVDAR